MGTRLSLSRRGVGDPWSWAGFSPELNTQEAAPLAEGLGVSQGVPGGEGLRVPLFFPDF